MKRTMLLFISCMLLCGAFSVSLSCLQPGKLTIYMLDDDAIKCSTSHVPITINGNAALDAFPEKTGAGTHTDPYIIENLEINVGATGNGIAIENTWESLVIRNCTITGAITPLAAGIFLNNCTSIKITNCIMSHDDIGIFLNMTYYDIVIASNNISRNGQHGIYLVYAYYNEIYSNIINKNNNTGIYVNSSLQNLIFNNTIQGNLIGAIKEQNSVGNKIFNNNCGTCNTFNVVAAQTTLITTVIVTVLIPLAACIALYMMMERRKRTKNEENKGGDTNAI